MSKKLILILLKAVPVIGALCCALNSLLAYFGFDLAWTGYIMYFVFLIAWYALAKYFKFCSFFFVLLYYIITCEVINTIDYLFGIPISDKHFFVLHVALFGFYAILYTILHVRDTRKLKEHIKENGGRA